MSRHTPSLEHLELALAAAARKLSNEITWLAAAETPTQRCIATERIVAAREKRDELSRTLRRLRADVGHPQAGGPTT